jgi:hypothetical protein
MRFSQTFGLLLAALALTSGRPVPAPAQGPFADVPADHPASAAVNEVAKQGLVNGYADSTFRGHLPMTRYEVAMALQRLLQIPQRADFVIHVWPPKPPAPLRFTDVPAEHWAADAVRDLQEWGIISGYPDGTYRGDQPMGAAEFALVLQRLREWAFRFVDLNRKTLGPEKPSPPPH